VPYQRLANVEQQIRSALELVADDLLARAAIDDRTDAQYLQEETLAYLIRRGHRAADDELVDRLSEVLVKRCQRVLKTQLHGLNQDQLEEAIAETIADLFGFLLEPVGSDRGDFLQVRFWVAVRPLRVAAFNRAIKEADRDVLLVALDPTGAGAEDGDEQHGLEVEDPMTPAIDTQLLAHEALEGLAPHVRQAFMMKLEGWPVEDRDPSVPTISQYFEKTSRTIRNWLAEAEAHFAAWRAEENRS
jgi:hypothetical protein